MNPGTKIPDMFCNFFLNEERQQRKRRESCMILTAMGLCRKAHVKSGKGTFTAGTSVRAIDRAQGTLPELNMEICRSCWSIAILAIQCNCSQRHLMCTVLS
ncbi:hypothetical protein M514_24463 [Trichuris suis]|uniref:Uncharacterized protein n=1 Tax=Trichuris suis TaxID=68888 RepID=A0A085N1N0_9BILA|nr:hypothetical protein M514_24463 [Trichuris suis]